MTGPTVKEKDQTRHRCKGSKAGPEVAKPQWERTKVPSSKPIEGSQCERSCGKERMIWNEKLWSNVKTKYKNSWRWLGSGSQAAHLVARGGGLIGIKIKKKTIDESAISCFLSGNNFWMDSICKMISHLRQKTFRPPAVPIECRSENCNWIVWKCCTKAGRFGNLVTLAFFSSAVYFGREKGKEENLMCRLIRKHYSICVQSNIRWIFCSKALILNTPGNYEVIIDPSRQLWAHNPAR